MAQQGRGKGFAVVLSMVAIAGVIGYIIYCNRKNKQDKGGDASGDGNVFNPSPSPSPSLSPSPSPSPSSTSSSGNPFSTKDDLLKFQRWVIKTIGDKTILGKGGSTGYGDDGAWGSKSASAWAKYQSKYNPAIVNSDGSVQSGSLPTWLLPNATSGSSTTSQGKKVISIDYVNFYETPSSFTPLNALPYQRNIILGTSDGKTYLDGKVPYYKVNVDQTIKDQFNFKGFSSTGMDTAYVNAGAVRLQ